MNTEQRLIFLSLTLLGASNSVAAQTPSAPPSSAQRLDTLEVKASRIPRQLLTTPAATRVVEAADIRRSGPGNQLEESLRRVPGLYLNNGENFAQGQKISTRGFGSRSAFGIRGITINVDGIPYTMPDGQSQIDAIDLDDAQRIEVVRGPSSVLYGNAAGGVINVDTADGLEPDAGGHISVTGGSHGLSKQHISHSGSEGNWYHSLGFTALKQDGYRDHSKVRRYLFNGKLGYHFDDHRSLTGIANILESPRANDPGGLTREEVKHNRRQANPNAGPIDARSKTSQQIFGVHYQDLDLGGGTLDASAWYGRRNYWQVLPMPDIAASKKGNIPQFVRHEFGARTSYANNLTVATLPLHYIVGADVSRQEDNRHRYSVLSDHLKWQRAGASDQQQNGTSAGLFAQGDLKLSDEWTLSSGVRYDNVHLTINDRQQHQKYGHHYDQWSYSSGLTWHYLPHHAAYATVGTAFQTPTFTEFTNPDNSAGFAPGIKPQKATNYEVGLRGNFESGPSYQLALYTIRSKDELVAYSVDNQSFYSNSGKTKREGLEAAISTPLGAGFSADSNFTYMRAHFSNNTSEGIERGNRFPGLPERIWSTRLNWSNDDLYLTLENQYLSGMYADNANDVHIGSSWVYNLRGRYEWALGGQQSVGIFAGLNNLFNEHYYSNIRINDANSRFYEPAATRTFYAGADYRF
ncbi:TonB-dependent receptor family protein [Carnimonas nigrificans]|uniref:TonB-dependent receptor family protein n=1 Tax=Carnimonas nigrificans TaxID=64323 RepID=UPI00046FF8AF|nr:TonB-dependent receptor [Carnimonas nigrificans]